MAVSPILEIEEVAPTQMNKTTPMNDMIVVIEAATNGQLPINMGGANTAVALSFTQYTGAIIFTAQSLVATGTLTVPQLTPTGGLPAYRLFAVRNTGSADLIVGGAIGLGVTVAAGGGMIIQNDGTNCWEFGSGGIGPIGPQGPPGGAISIPYAFNTGTTNVDPGAGMIALNDATQNASTAIYAEVVDVVGTNWQSVLDTFDASTSANKGTLRLFKTADLTKWIVFAVNARTTHTGYREYAVTALGASATNPFSSGDALSLEFDRTGDAGSDVVGSGEVVVTTAGSVSTVSLGTIASGHLIANSTTATAAPADTTLAALLDLNFGTAGGILQRSGAGWSESEILTGVTLAGVVTNSGTITGGTIAGAIHASGTLTGTLTNAGVITGGSITGQPTPSAPSDVVTKAYADLLAQATTYQPTATVATTGALPAYTYANGTAGVGATITVTATGTLTIDGHVTALAELVLVKDEAGGNAPYNGLYQVTTAGAVGVQAVLTRAASMDTPGQIAGALLPVDNVGTTNANSLWLCNPAGPVTVGTTALLFSELNKAADLTTTGGVHISGNQLSVNWNGGVVAGLTAADLVISGSNLQFAARAAVSLMGNPGTATARPSDIAVGAGLSLSTSGTLSATGSGGTVTQIVAGKNMTGGTITGSGTIGLQNSPTMAATASTAPVVVNGGTTTPLLLSGEVFGVTSDSGQVRIVVNAFGSTPILTGVRASGTAGAPSAVALNNQLLAFNAFGYGTTGYSTASRGSMAVLAAEAWTDTAQGALITWSITPTGGTATTEAIRLSSSGHLLIGTTSDATSDLLQVNGGAKVTTLTIGSSPSIASIGTGLTVVAGALNITAASLDTVDFSTLPTSDPGGGKLWLNGPVVQVGTA